MSKNQFPHSSHPSHSFPSLLLVLLIAIISFTVFTGWQCEQSPPQTSCQSYAQLSYDATLIVCEALTIFASDTSVAARQQAVLIKASLASKVLNDAETAQAILIRLTKSTQNIVIQRQLNDLSTRMADDITKYLNGPVHTSQMNFP